MTIVICYNYECNECAFGVSCCIGNFDCKERINVQKDNKEGYND